jgi:hypothetical protein
VARRLEVEIVGDHSSYQRSLNASTKSTQRFGTTLGTVTKSGAAFAAGFVVVQQGLRLFGAVAKSAFAEMTEGQKVAAQTGAVLTSTGKAANVTARQIEGLATSLSRMSGVDDEAIQAGENMLLTFTKIHNEVGKGNDIFNQATKATLDLSVALGKDMPSAALMVGKALNDPIAGMTALGRAGVQFTAAQKETIKALVESGDILGAQQLILAELETQMGGSAKAYGETLPGGIAKAKNAFNEMTASVLTAALPALEKLAGFVAQGASFFATHETAAKALTIVVAGLAAALVAAAAAQLAMNLAVLANPYVAAGAAVVVLTAALVILWQQSETARKVILALGLVVAALPTALIIAWRESETFRSVVRAAFAAAKAAADFLKGSVDEVAAAFGALRAAGSAVAGFLQGAFAAAAATASNAASFFAAELNVIRTALSAIRTAAAAVAGFLEADFRARLAIAQGAASALAGALHAIANALSAIIGLAGRAADAIRSIPSVGGIIGKIPGFASGVSNFAGGLAIVGEHGPELVHLPGGSSVTPNGRFAGAGGLTVNIYGSVYDEQDFISKVRSALYQAQGSMTSLRLN